MSTSHADVIVIGAGMAGVSAAAGLARSCKVIVLERESQPGYHSTGRSAAFFSETYGSDLVRALTRASRRFYETPPAGFATQALLEPCGSLMIARDDQLSTLEAVAQEEDFSRTGKLISRDEVLSLCPVLRSEYVAGGLYDPAPASIDVASLLDGYRRQLLERRGSLVTGADVIAVSFQDGVWKCSTSAGEFTGRVLVNAAGAWADQMAVRAGVRGIGLEPRRRTAVVVRADGAESLGTRALVIDADEQFYFRPESGGVLVSPADETLTPPCDAQPEELDVAIAIDRLSSATTLDVRAVRSKWAGLRSFVADRNPVVGFDSENRHFFWLAGQGGYGIQTAPAIAELAASLVLGESVPDSLALTQRHVENLAAARLR
jgi:D-arginine dehydrogenase